MLRIPIRRMQYRRTTAARQHFATNTADEDDPYKILNIPPGSSPEIIKESFIKLAMIHHPDQKGNTETFTRLRAAFESLSSEAAVVPAEKTKQFDHWFAHETKSFLSFHIPGSIVNEIINVHRTMNQPINDKGGYWEMSRQLAERQVNHGDAPAQIQSGVAPLRRKRR